MSGAERIPLDAPLEHGTRHQPLRPDSAIGDIITGLLTSPARYVACAGTYADGYLDALLDMLTGLGQLQPPANYQALRMQIIQKQLKGG